MPRGFMFPNSQVQVWRPLLTSMPPQQQIRRDMHNHNIVARLRPGVSVAEAFSELDGIAARYKEAHPDESVGRGANVIPLHGFFVFNAQRPLVILLGAVGCLLLIACVNIASLVLSRAASRTREISIRAALGAGRGGIIRQLVIESVILALTGGALGAISAVSITDFLASKAPGAGQLVSSEGVPVDPVVFLFAFGIAVLSGVGVGLYPAIRASRTDLANDLKSGGRSATATRAHARLRTVLVATELAFSVVLVMGAGLLLRSFFVLYQVQPGMRVEQTLTMEVSIPVASYRSPAQRASLLSQIAERVRTIPGVRSAGLTSCAPLSGVCNLLFYYVDGRPFVSGKFLQAPEQAVDPEYFASAGIPLLQGRTFKAEDGIGFDLNNPRPGSVVLSESLAKTVFPGEDPIGKHIFFDFEVQRGKIQGTPVPRYEVIGVVGDVLSTLDAKPAAMLYRPLLGMGNTAATVLLHTAVEPKSVIGVARDTLRRMDPGLAVSRVRTGEETLSSSTSNRQFNMLLLGTFAGLALLLAAIGLYGLVSHTVSQRQAEIGIRLALGATRQQVNRLILFQGLKPAMAGVVLGVVGSGFAAPILRAQLFGITPMDLWTFATVPALLLVIAVLACCLPARRASMLDPTTALRSE